MPLSDGALLGPYEILSALGAGGMGEVFRARDIRLDRIVAIRFCCRGWPRRRGSPALSSAKPAPFQPEPPHICALYDIGRQDGVRLLVMDYDWMRKDATYPARFAEARERATQTLEDEAYAGPTRRHRRPLAQ